MAALHKNTSTLKLNTGAHIPVIGLGTWQSSENEGYNATLEALKAGYRHIDTAAIYKNEEEIGRAIRDSNIPRDELFVTTKLWGTQHRNPTEALDQSLKRLGLDYVDLYLMHWPVALKTDLIKDGNLLQIPEREDGSRDVDLEDWNFVKTWELMQELPKEKARAIGVSNFSINNLKELLNSKGNKVVPAANQIEIHPLLPQDELINFCKEKGIVLEAYSPLGSTDAPILKEEEITEIAKKNGVNAGQLVISWHAQRGYVVLPKSVKPERIHGNQETFKLSDEDFATLSNYAKKHGERRVVSPNWGPFKPFV
ncbi:Glycerol 2-dehydrogenase (NADP(+)) [Nakaseomyces glabratus]|nr:Aldo/keto reductase family signature 2 [Nakaseomyces glabratus]KAH7585612.1 Aldo/keto reductase family signature 1 [Nakaseomyces glabratus]KAH7599244.1 Aldo/keto reductase family signature 2 [Nakaseomyces glabratus]KAH7612657.1 Aldo/keto reductase family signature 1 [Nakaseomyces glabratus]KAI8383126.1 Aldo/keto reductase family signature 2 [Nakaseomyces glabratus]